MAVSYPLGQEVGGCWPLRTGSRVTAAHDTLPVERSCQDDNLSPVIADQPCLRFGTTAHPHTCRQPANEGRSAKRARSNRRQRPAARRRVRLQKDHRRYGERIYLP